MEEINVLEPHVVEWVLVDDSHPYYNVWETKCPYRECFAKGENPNQTKHFGQHTLDIKRSKGVNYKKDVKKWLGDKDAG